MMTGEMNRTETPTILIVDDNVDLCDLLALLLTNEGYRVQVAIDGHTAWQMLTTGHVDLLLVDYQLPDLLGNELVTMAKTRTPTLRTLLISASPQVDTIASACHADDYFLKGTPLEQLLQQVAHLLTEG